ncbi:hypothetical protein A3H26_01690 [candidate division WWE3 bacterium RIFCSPLOWO2_12_FULL_36_10]|uniref:Ribose-5-phosphate isomerase n=1 Tax=candidate division WWE3 bacterium RIFCSPLOWO2_12_FULL_36_10 TaxID=1802630 RepID=A0A1F4VHM1_UNCKA|nr:MAG: hypothetical protein A3H26_01690 [candidate division WWE3 bacterium RIFCSPLOWO2_12_FULL_36_10]
MLYITSDHGGLKLKSRLIEFLKQKNIEFEDCGPNELIPSDDYTDYVIPVMRKVLESPKNNAVLICKNGVGVSIIANRFKGIRCALSWRLEHAVSSRNDDDANVLALPANYISEDEAEIILENWLNKDFSKEERFVRRINKLEEIK